MENQTHLSADAQHMVETFGNAESDPTGRSANQPGAKLDAGKIYAGILDDFALALMAVAEVGTFF